MDSTSLEKAAQIVGVTSAACLSGYIACFSYAAVPAMAIPSAPANILVRQWAKAYEIGSNSSPPLAFMSAASFAYLSYASTSTPLRKLLFGIASPRLLYGLAAGLVVSIVPYTFVVMHPQVNDRLHEIEARAEMGDELKAEDGEVKELLRHWVPMNFARAALTGAGAVLGAVAVIAL
ncbi:hypothetical protein BAUCODRAFT_34729 [Baudoinia panamericana UAMH 10762]|uniref:DUF1772 domain-containing protein n=1 Tax=Baudoinia panamericana (strain UAMH 10762) TaxID=717646 RepID=M2MWN9_BAUPA|nr:uncharacterized protein BAUCODRAFT_34729 [Baudoinia panamericana UAMH 10762]EMC95968.1 hypothetical protein BAUCODRAFT_34729 [Baudoinia panamericana UAMH 10762]